MIAECEITEKKESQAVENEHLIAEIVGDAAGATLVVVGSVHGNEPSGALALRKVTRSLQMLREKLRGRVYFLAGNTRALEQGVRFIESDLNRHWTPANLLKNKSNFPVKRAEDLEQRELIKIFDEILKAARDEVYVLDLHTTSAKSKPFATVGDTMRNRNFAQKFPITILLGIEEQLDGTMLEYLNSAGAVTLGFEGGQHCTPEAVENHEALVWLALANAGLLAVEDVPEIEHHRQTLLRAIDNNPQVVEIRYRHAISLRDEFEMKPGFESFQKIRRGQTLANDIGGEIKAKESGLILMPLYQKQGEDGFFIGREVAAFWLWLSAILRNWNVWRLMPLLPGVKKYNFTEESLVVNTRVARFFPLQIFHLLGFRKRRWRDHQLVVSRRRHDTISPFTSRR